MHINTTPLIKWILVVLLVQTLALTEAMAQVPQLFNYQGIARDNKGNPLQSQSLSLKISVLATADATVSDYDERHSVKTNEFGLYTLQIGNGTPLLGDMKSVKWETGNKYIRVAIDPKGGDDFQWVGTTQLLSVPYALYADKAGMARETVNSTGGTRAGAVSTSATGTGTTNYLTKFTAANTIYNSQLFDNGSNIGIGTASPASKLHITTSTGNQEHLRMENLNSGGWGKFIMYNDNVLNYHTFTKYGSAVAGTYGGASALFPYANLLVFGSNNSPTVLANGSNIGFATVNGATASFKFIAVQSTGNVGLGGNATPSTNVQINRTDATGDTLKITNNTTGHTAADGLDIRTTGNNADIINRENGILTLGTNNLERVRIDAAGNIGIGTTSPSTKLDIAGQVKISGGTPGLGKVLTSDATGLATWQTPTTGTTYTAGTGITIAGNVISNSGDLSNTNEIQTLSLVGSTLSLSNGGGSVTLPAGGGGVTSVNGATGVVTQSLTLGSTGTTPNIAGSGTNAVTLNLPTASATNSGVLSSANWTTFNNKLNTSGGSNNFITKYTPNGLTVGNSKLKDSTGLWYNVNPSSSYMGIYKNNGSSNNFFGFEGSPTSGATIITLEDSNTTNIRGIIMGAKNSAAADQGIFFNNQSFDGIGFGSNSGPLFTMNLHNGRIANSVSIGNAGLNINSAYDTAGHFTSSSSNWLGSGILRAEYVGTAIQDNVALYGRSVPSIVDNFGYGLIAEGGYRGVSASSNINSVASNVGVLSSVTNNGDNVGTYSSAGSFLFTGGTKFGAYGEAFDGDFNIGVGGSVSPQVTSLGWGGYFTGKNTGVFGRADSSSAYQTHYFGSGGYAEAIGVYGVGNMIGGGNGRLNAGVAGSSVNSNNYLNIGTIGEADSATFNYGIFGYAPVATNNRAGYFLGNVQVVGNLSKSGGTFKIDHPQDPENKYLIHSFVESPDMMNVYNGNIVTDANGIATVTLPSYFEAENKDFKYQLTVIDNSADFVMAKVSKKVSNNTFEIKTNKANVEVSWQVTGVRQDAWANANRVLDVVEKAPEDKGYYLNPEVFGQPETRREGPVKGRVHEGNIKSIPTAAEYDQHQLKMKKEMKTREEQHAESKRNWKPQTLPKSNEVLIQQPK